MGYGVLIFLGVVAIIVLAVVARGVRTVPQGYEWTVERFGRYRITLSPGLHLINPFIDSIGHKINVQETVLEIPAQNVITKDNAVVVVDGIVFYQVIDASRAAYEVRNLEVAVSNITMTNIRTAIGALDLDETLSKRDEINERLLRVLDAATEPWGTKITRVELKDVRPPEDVQESMAKQLAADRERRAAILRAEGLKQAAILEAEGAKQAQILAAEGRLESARREAEARERLAEAEARATAAVSEAVAAGDVRALNYFVAQKYVEAMTQIGASPNSRLVLMPMETSGLVGTIAGIAELARTAVPAAGRPAAE
jgi:regulator of protease activity HflC (stomatin/prohibitin superfamily)